MTQENRPFFYNEIKTDGFLLKRDEAIWQYIVDHSRPIPTGHRILFYLNDRVHWERCIKSRMNGIYRQDEEKAEKGILKITKEYASDTLYKKTWNKKILKISKSKEWKVRIALFIYQKSRNFLKDYDI